MSLTEANLAVFERFCHDVLVRGDLGAIDDLVDPWVVSHAPLPGQAPGREGFKAALATLRDAFPDLEFELRDLVAQGEKVVGYFGVSGTHRGGFLGLAPTGRVIRYDEVVIVRLADGKIIEHWSVADSLAMMRSLGAIAEPSAAGAPAAARAGQIKSFFADYAERFNRSLAGEPVDAEEVADSFASHFVEASPVGVSGGRNGLLFRWMIPRGFAHYRKLGTTRMEVADLAIEEIDPLHALARVHWDSRYRRKDGSADHIEFDVTYLLQFERGGPKIFAFITGDEERVLREHGLT